MVPDAARLRTEDVGRAAPFEATTAGHTGCMSTARILGPVTFFGKQYLWVRLHDGRIALARADWLTS